MIDKKRMQDVIKKRQAQPKDPNLTIDVKNEEAEAAIDGYLKEKTPENLNRLLQLLRTRRILVPANVADGGKPLPCLLKGPDGQSFLPIYTSKERVPKEPKAAALINMPFLAANHMARGQKEQVAGVVLNPFGQNLIFKRALVEKIDETEQNLRKNGQPKKMTLTPEQYVLFERKQFEFGFLPKRFFEQGKELMEALCEKKEECIDALFEESYQQKRMYPYLPEDFSVMAMNISEELLIVRIDLPARDMGAPSCFRIYLAWDDAAGAGRYFTIERTQNPGMHSLGEIKKDKTQSSWKHIIHGEAPAEGSQLQKIIDLAEGKG